MVASKLAFEYDAPMFYDFEASESPLGHGRVDDWFDTSATKGLQSPNASGGGKVMDKDEREVTSDAVGRARSVLGEITNAAVVPVAKQVVGNDAALDSKIKAPVVEKPVTRSQAAASAPQSKPVRTAASKPPHRGRQLTVPKSPMLLSRLRSDGRVRVKSTEELELEQIEKERRALSAYKRKQTVAGDVGGDGDGRSKKRMKTTSVTVVAGGFTVGADVVQGGMRRSTRSSTRANAHERAWKPKLTVPQSPAFATNSRVRASRYKSTEELQLEEIAKVRLAKGIGKKVGAVFKHNPRQDAKAIPSTRSRSRPASLEIPEPSKSGTGSRGAKSTTAAHSALSKGASMPAARPRTTRSAKLASPQETSVFQEGPITRNRGHVVETKKRDKCQVPMDARGEAAVVHCKRGTSEPRAISPPLAGVGMRAAATRDTEYRTNKTMNEVMNMNTRPRPATRGASMLRGGAVRVVRTEDPEDTGQNTPGSLAGHGDGISSVACDPPMTRGRSILDKITGAQKKNETGAGNVENEGERPPPRMTFEQLSRRRRHHNPLFEFKQ